MSGQLIFFTVDADGFKKKIIISLSPYLDPLHHQYKNRKKSKYANKVQKFIKRLKF